jgi:hypothetical protein
VTQFKEGGEGAEHVAEIALRFDESLKAVGNVTNAVLTRYKLYTKATSGANEVISIATSLVSHEQPDGIVQQNLEAGTIDTTYGACYPQPPQPPLKNAPDTNSH